MENIISTITAYLLYVVPLAVIVVGLVHLYVTHRLEEFARATVSAPAGVAFRRSLASEAYDLLPVKVGPLPIGLIKLVVSREQWCAWVDLAFNEAVELAEKMELPEELPTA